MSEPAEITTGNSLLGFHAADFPALNGSAARSQIAPQDAWLLRVAWLSDPSPPVPHSTGVAHSSCTLPAPERVRTLGMLAAMGCEVHEAREARELVYPVGEPGKAMRMHVALIEQTPDENVWTARWRALRAARPDVLGVLVTARPSPESLRAAMRERMFDVVCGADLNEIRVSIQRCRKLAGELLTNAKRAKRLRNRCRNLEASRTELLRQVGALSEGVMQTYKNVADNMRMGALAAEFEAMIRQELDIEGLLRTTLEYTLKKTGPTNGAIFLPTSCGDFSLGAYINYDCPKDTAETLMGNLADTLAPACDEIRALRFERSITRLRIPSIDENHWLAGSAVAVQAIWREGECLAVIAFFRDKRNPFTEDTRTVLTMLHDLFGTQLARVIKTHHRHKPKDQWGCGGSMAA